MFPTLSEALTGERLTVGPAVLQQVDAADRADPPVPDRCRAAARLAEVHVHQPARPVPVGGDRRRGRPAVGLAAAGRPVLGGRPLLRAVRLRRRDHRARSSCAARGSGARPPAPTSSPRMVGLVARSKRRYGGYIVHLGIVLMFLGFAGEAFKVDEQVLLKPGEQSQVGQVRRAQRRRARDRRRAEADDHRRTSRCCGTASEIDQVYPAAVVLPEARAGADDPGGDSPRRGRGPLHRAARLRPRDPVGDAAGGDQPAGELDLGRLRCPRLRDDDRAAARAGLRVRGRAGAGGGRHRAAARGFARRRPGRRRRSTWRTRSSGRSCRRRRSRRTCSSR